MNDELKKLQMREGEKTTFAQWRAEGLTHSEKSEMRFFLRERVALSTSRMGVSETASLLFRSISFRQAISFSVIVMLVLASTGIGVAKASEQSLPGETLYKVKTIISEPVLGLLKRTPEEKITWAMTLSERRMNEADALATSGKLGEKESREIEVLIEKHHDSLERYVDEDDDIFETELDRHSDKIELRIEIKEGKRLYHIEERKNRKEEREWKGEVRDIEKESEKNDEEVSAEKSEDGILQKEQKKEERKRSIKIESSKGKSELKKWYESVKQQDSDSKTEDDVRDEETESDSSGKGSDDEEKDDSDREDEKGDDSDHEDEAPDGESD